jgi:hypothetical protein
MAERGRRAGTYGSATGDPTLDGLLAQTPELARRWAIALIENAGPDEFGGVDLASISREGAALIERLLEAAARDGEEPATDTSLAALAGARNPAELARGVETLRAVLWEAAAECSPRARSEARAARRLGELGDRLAGACAELLASELEGFSAPDTDPAREHPRAATATIGGATRIVIVDERGGGSSPAGRPEPGADEPRGAGAQMASHEGAPPMSGGGRAGEPDRGGLIAARDARLQGPAAWIGAIGAQLEQFAQDSRPFAVMLIELLEGAVAEPAEDPKLVLERALDARLGDWRGLALTRERPGRYWVVAPGADRARAELLKQRLEAGLAGEPSDASGGLSSPVAIGVAVCPDDAVDAAGLAAQADLDLYAARSHPMKGHPPYRGAGRQARAAARRSPPP